MNASLDHSATSTALKKVLIIAYYWPPAGGPGVQRWFHFVRHLPSYGIAPVVYVPENAQYPILDHSLQENVPQSVVLIKRPISEPYKWVSWLFKNKTKRLSQGLIQEKSPHIVERFLRFVRGNFFIPDARVSWVVPSVAYLAQYIKAHQIDTIISTGPPHSMHLIAKGLVKQNPDLKWIADFRDPWTNIGYHPALYMMPWVKKKHIQLERDVLSRADVLLTTSFTTAEQFSQMTESAVHVLTNGYEPFSPIDAMVSQTEDQFRLVHIGSLLSKRNPTSLWKALRALIKEEVGFENKLVMDFVGVVSEEVVQSLKENGLISHCHFHGYLPHKEARMHQFKANVLLLIEIDQASHKGIIPGKIFEYLQANRPILALGPDDWDIEKILPKDSKNSLCGYGDFKTMKTFLRNQFNSNAVYSNEIDPSLAQYERKNITRQLAQIILNIP